MLTEVLTLLKSVSGNRHACDAIYGPYAAELRAQVASLLHGRKLPKSAKECQYGRLRDALWAAAGIEWTCIADGEHKLNAIVRAA